MKSITLELPEEQVALLKHAAGCRNMTLAELLTVRLIELFDDPADLFDPKGQRLREEDQKLLRRLL
jgi:hypothetical protein